MNPISRVLIKAYACVASLCLLSAACFFALLKPGEIGGFAALPVFLPAFPWIMLIGRDTLRSAWLFTAGMLLCYALNFACLYGAGVVMSGVASRSADRESSH